MAETKTRGDNRQPKFTALERLFAKSRPLSLVNRDVLNLVGYVQQASGIKGA